MDKIFCCIRKIPVLKTPEEAVRQKVLHFLTAALGYPESGFVIEQSLHAMPHLQNTPKNHFPNRRADILFFAKDIHKKHALYPLLLVECKATKLSNAAMSQVLSYNYYLQAHVVAVANATELKCGFKAANGTYSFEEGLPHFAHILQKVL